MDCIVSGEPTENPNIFIPMEERIFVRNISAKSECNWDLFPIYAIARAVGGIVERPFGTLNTALFSTLPGYTGSNVQQRPKDAEKDARLTLRQLEQVLVRYIVDHYNQSIDARMVDQTRFQRWESG